MKVTVLGEGAWGTAVASVLADRGYAVCIWCHEESSAGSINRFHRNDRYVAGHTLASNITATTSLREALDGAVWIFEAIPVKFLRDVVTKAATYTHSNQKWVVLSKGIEQRTVLLPSQIIQQIIPNASITMLSGPSFAADVLRKQPTAVSAAATDVSLAQELKVLIETAYFKVVVSDDVIGHQVCAAVKNLIALAVGIAQGAGYTDNTRALLMMLGMRDMKELVHAMGGKESTVYGLAGIGDVILTACSEQSRNVTAGRLLGAGSSLSDVAEKSKGISEGINTIESVQDLAKQHHVTLSFFNLIAAYIHQTISFEQCIKNCLELI